MTKTDDKGKKVDTTTEHYTTEPPGEAEKTLAVTTPQPQAATTTATPEPQRSSTWDEISEQNPSTFEPATVDGTPDVPGTQGSDLVEDTQREVVEEAEEDDKDLTATQVTKESKKLLRKRK